jgi:hypothetical protein
MPYRSVRPSNSKLTHSRRHEPIPFGNVCGDEKLCDKGKQPAGARADTKAKKKPRRPKHTRMKGRVARTPSRR